MRIPFLEFSAIMKFNASSVLPFCCPWSAFLGAALIVGLFTPGATAEDTLPSPNQLSNAALVEAYEAAGTALTGTVMMPGAEVSSIMDRGNVSYARLTAVRKELLRRGRECVPELNAFLNQEAPKQRNPTNRKENLSFTGDVLGILARIGDDRSARIALKVLSGWEGRVDPSERYAASRALERLTYVSFYKVRPLEFDYGEYVEHKDAQDWNSDSTLDKTALTYKNWLEGEGKDPAQWLPMAVRRAHELLTSENLEQVYCAASFLRPEKALDDLPEVTMSRLAEVVGKMELQADGISYFINGKGVPVGGGNWIKLLTDYGPRARKFSKLLTQLQRQQAVNQWGFYAFLRDVGGPDIMAFFFERLPVVSAEVAKITQDPGTPKGFGSDDTRGWWFDSQREIQYGIHRWAGRLFATDAERLAWWKANQGRTPEQWLSDNLKTIAEQADKNILWAASISRRILPDLPIGEYDVDLPESFIPPPDLKRIQGPFRTVWLRENRSKLSYDGNAGCFRLKQ